MIFNDRAYGMLDAELAGAGAQSTGRKAMALLDLRGLDLDFVGLGIASRHVDTAEQFTRAVDHAIADPGPHLTRSSRPGELRSNRSRHPAVSGPPAAAAHAPGRRVK